MDANGAFVKETGCWVSAISSWAYSQGNLEHAKWICESVSLWSFPEQGFLHSPDALCEWENQEEVLLFYLFLATLQVYNCVGWAATLMEQKCCVLVCVAQGGRRINLEYITSTSAALQLANNEASPNDRAQSSSLCGKFLSVSIQGWSHWSSNVPKALFSSNVLQGFHAAQLQNVLLKIS